MDRYVSCRVWPWNWTVELSVKRVTATVVDLNVEVGLDEGLSDPLRLGLCAFHQIFLGRDLPRPFMNTTASSRYRSSTAALPAAEASENSWD